MRKCIKCQAQIASDVNFCPRCGAAQPEAAGRAAGSEAETLSMDKSSPTHVPETIRVTAQKNAFVTAGVAQPRSWKGVILGVGVFVISIAIGAVLALEMRAHRNTDEPLASKSQANGQPSSTVIIENPDAGEKETSPAAMPSTGVETKKEKKEQKPPVQTAQSETRTQKPAPVTAPPPTEPLRPEPPSREDVPEFAPELNDRGFILVKFKVSGEALVKIQGGEASVVPLSGSTISDVQRLVGRPLPARYCRVRLKQRSIDNAIATLVEEPNARNNFTATVRVTNTDPNSAREARINFVLIWHFPNARGRVEDE